MTNPLLDRSAQQFLVIRHAESAWNERGLWQGQADPPLCDRGSALLEKRAPEIATSARNIDWVIASDLERAFDTAHAVARELGAVLWVSKDLRERDAGAWTGMSRDEIESSDDPQLAALRRGVLDARPPGGESGYEVRGRVQRGLRQAASAANGVPIAWVTHLGVLRAVLPGAVLGYTETRWITCDLQSEDLSVHTCDEPVSFSSGEVQG